MVSLRSQQTTIDPMHTSSILQPRLVPARAQISGIQTSRVDGTGVHGEHFHAHADAGVRLVVLIPDRQADGVVAGVVEDARRDREFDLVSDVGEEFACE
jgi:hypothetical protein